MEQRIDNTIHAVSTCPQTHWGWDNHWKSFPYPFTWLWDNNDGNEGKGFVYNEKSLCDNLGFTGGVSKKHYWNSFGNRNIIWFYAHFRMLNFYKQFPHYDWYWFYDDDVTCDNWTGLIESFGNVDTDFLAWYIFSKEDYGNGIRPIDRDTTSEHMWFERFPGDGDNLPWWIEQYYGSFFPVVRFSNKALDTLLQQFRWGVWGYSEGFVPTILNGYKHSLGSIFNKDGTSQYYDVNQINLKHKHENIGWSWI